MLNSSGGDAPAGNGLLVRLLSVPLRWLALAVGALILAISGLFGGLDDVGDPNVRTLALGQKVAGSPFNVTIHGVRVVDEAPRVKHRTTPARWIVVEVTLENTDTETNIIAHQTMRIEGVEGVKKPEDHEVVGEYPDYLTMAGNGELALQIHPGLPTRVTFLWEQVGSAPVPSEVRVIVIGMTKREQRGRGEVWWFDHKPIATLRTPVSYVRNASPSPTPRATLPATPSARPSGTVTGRPGTPTASSSASSSASPTRSR